MISDQEQEHLCSTVSYLLRIGSAFVTTKCFLHDTQKQNALKLVERVHQDFPRLRDTLPRYRASHFHRELISLALSLTDEFTRSKRIMVIDHAIQLGKYAATLCPLDSAELSLCMAALRHSYTVRFAHLGMITDLNETIKCQRSVLNTLPDTDPAKSKVQSSLAGMLRTRFECVGNLPDLDEAIRLFRQTIDLTPDDDADKSANLAILGVGFS